VRCPVFRHVLKLIGAQQVGVEPYPGDVKPMKHLKYIQESWPLEPLGWMHDESKVFTEDRRSKGLQHHRVFSQMTIEAANTVDSEDILAAFERADHDDGGQSMRLSYEYLQCVGHSRGFYEKLVGEQFLNCDPPQNWLNNICIRQISDHWYRRAPQTLLLTLFTGTSIIVFKLNMALLLHLSFCIESDRYPSIVLAEVGG